MQVDSVVPVLSMVVAFFKTYSLSSFMCMPGKSCILTMCRKFCFSLLGASVAAKNTDPNAFNESQLVSSFHFKLMYVSCGPLLFEASLVNLVFTESSSCILKISVGSCQYFFLMQYQETVLRVHFKEGHSFFSEEAKSPEFRHAAI